MSSHRALRIAKPALGALCTSTVAYATYSRTFGAPSIAAEAPTTNNAAANKFFAGLPLQFVDLKLQSVEQVNHDTKKLRFELPDTDAVSGIPVISSLLTKATTEGSWLPTLRPYSPISDPNSPGHIDLLVKRYPTGAMSRHLHSLQPGSTHSFMKKPLSEYTWTSALHPSVALIAGGAGITPLYQLTRAIFSDPGDKDTRVTLVFGVNTDADLLFRDEFEALQREFPGRFRVVYTVSTPGVGSGAESIGDETPNKRKGRVTEALLREVLPPPTTSGLKVFFCGPPAMEEAVVGKKGWGKARAGGLLARLGYEDQQVLAL